MTRHPETELIPYLRGDLHAEERESVSRHLQDCGACRASLEETRAVLEAMRAERPALPEPDWRRYRAELRARAAERSARRWSWRLPRLIPIAASAAAAALALVLMLRPSAPAPPVSEDLPAFQDAAIGSHLDLLRDYPVVENLDLLEDLDVVQDLDALAPPSAG